MELRVASNSVFPPPPAPPVPLLQVWISMPDSLLFFALFFFNFLSLCSSILVLVSVTKSPRRSNLRKVYPNVHFIVERTGWQAQALSNCTRVSGQTVLHAGAQIPL